MRDAETIGPEFCPSSVNARYYYDAGGIRWRHIVSECKRNHRNEVVGVPGPQKDFKLTMASNRAALSGNTSLNATFSNSSPFYILQSSTTRVTRKFVVILNLNDFLSSVDLRSLY